MSNPKAVKYRRLALIEPDLDKARLLHKLAESEQGILVTANWRARPSRAATAPQPVDGQTP